MSKRLCQGCEKTAVGLKTITVFDWRGETCDRVTCSLCPQCRENLFCKQHGKQKISVVETGTLDNGEEIDIMHAVCHDCVMAELAQMGSAEKRQWLALIGEANVYAMTPLSVRQQATVNKLVHGDGILYRTIFGRQLYGESMKEAVTYILSAQMYAQADNEAADFENGMEQAVMH